MRILFTSIFLWFFLLPVLQAQYAGSVEYASRDGVIQPMPVFAPFQDSKGYIWVSSRGGGINRFDGKKWENFSTEDGVLFSWSIPVFEDREGGVWIKHTYQIGVTRYIDGQFERYAPLNKEEERWGDHHKQFPVESIKASIFYDWNKGIPAVHFTDSIGQIRIYEYDYVSRSFDLEGYSLFGDAMPQKYAPYPRLFCIDGEGEYAMRVTLDDRNETRIVYPDLREVVIPSIRFNFKGDNAWLLAFGNMGSIFFCIKKDGKLWMMEQNKRKEVPQPDLLRYGNNTPDISLEPDRLSLNRESDGTYTLFSVWKVKDKTFTNSYIMAAHQPNTMEITQSLMFREDKETGQFIKDKAGTYWYCNGKEVTRLFPDQMIVKAGVQGMPYEAWGVAQGGDGMIWFSSYKGPGLVPFDGYLIRQPSPDLSTYTSFNDGSVQDRSGNVYFPSNNNSLNESAGGLLRLNMDGSPELLCKGQVGFFLDWDRKDQLMYGTSKNGLWILENGKPGVDPADWQKIDKDKGLQLLNVVTALEDRQGRYWMGRGSQGLAVYLPGQDTVYNWINESDPGNYGVQSMTEDSRGNLWLGTDKGLCYLENPENIGPGLDLKNKIERLAIDYTGESMVQICKLYDEHTLIAGNNIGYFLIDLDAWYAQPRQLIIHSFTPESGHQGESMVQNGIFIDDKRDVWMMGASGAVRYSPGLIPLDTSVSTVRVDSVVVGPKTFTDFEKKLSLASTERTVRIHFSHPHNPMLYDNIRFRYRLSPDSTWSPLREEAFIDFLNLSPGEYTFEVLTEKNGLRSDPAQVSFRIAYVLWQNPLFWLGIFGLLIVGGIYFRRKEKKILEQQIHIEKSKVQMSNIAKEKDKLQVQAIINQLNPHFINNALQWLQVRLDNTDDDEGVGVVGKLSENISTIFKNSRSKKAYHSIPREIKLAENYLYIQKRRFRDRLEYEIPDADALGRLEEINIPLMMVQIHVENAVEHGIRNKLEGKGTVKVRFEEDQKYVTIFIEDDGVGRAAAKKIGSKGTQNGTLMLKELESIYNKQNELPISQTYQDHIYTDQSGKPHGTRVIIKIPKHYNFEI